MSFVGRGRMETTGNIAKAMKEREARRKRKEQQQAERKGCGKEANGKR